jgi:UDP:flavonoid glycosyltransferase YjiC (YdhE family)
MRVLFTVQPSTGHLRPLVPVARALLDAGHEVAVCSAPMFRSEVEEFGLTHVPAGLDWLTGDHSTWTAFPPMPPPGPAFAGFVVTVFADITTARMVPDLETIAREWKPDVIVREHMEFGGCLVAELLGIPHVSVAGNGYSAIDSPDVHYFPGNRLMVAEAMARHRRQLDLAPDPDVRMPFRHRHLAFTPPSWDGDGVPRPANIRHLRHVSAVRPGASLPSRMDELDERPLVLASLGTVFHRTPGVLDAIVDGLGDEPINLVVVAGDSESRERLESRPANVVVEARVDQPLLLERCRAFVTHGGFNSVKEAAVLGVPMVVIPITADQPYCAQRCEALGIGRAVGGEERSPASIREALRSVLNDARYRDNATRFREAMHALPGPDRVVSLIEHTVDSAARTG